MRTPALCVAAVVVALSLSVTACSSGSKSTTGAPAAATTSASGAARAVATKAAAANGSAGSAAGTVDVCSLMSSAQASSANHVTYGAAKAKALMAGYDTCTYHNTGKHESPIDIQDLTVSVISLAGCWPQLESADGPGANVKGVGDAAFGAQISLDVKVGHRCITIAGLTDAELQGRYGPDTAMAKIILAGLH